MVVMAAPIDSRAKERADGALIVFVSISLRLGDSVPHFSLTAGSPRTIMYSVSMGLRPVSEKA